MCTFRFLLNSRRVPALIRCDIFVNGPGLPVIVQAVNEIESRPGDVSKPARRNDRVYRTFWFAALSLSKHPEQDSGGMIIYRALRRETARTAVAIIIVLVALFTFVMFSTLLGRAARGDYADTAVLTLLGLQVLKRLDLLIPLSLYLGLLLTLGRWYRDNEMTVLAACGIGLPQLVRPIFTLVLVFATVAAALALYVNPLADRLIEKTRHDSGRRTEASMVNPGTFIDAPGGRVVYAERVDPDGPRFDSVFVTRLQADREGVVLAQSGRPTESPDRSYDLLVLENGTAYEGRAGETEYRIMSFDRATLWVRPRPATEAPLQLTSRPTRDLLRVRSPDTNAEFHWRLARPVGVLVMALFALGLAYTDARRGRMANIFIAILVYFIYSNLTSFGQALLRKDKIPPLLGLWWVHGLMLVAATYLLWCRANNRPLFAPFRLRRSR